MANFTPGPWAVDEKDIRDNGVYGYLVHDADGIGVCDHATLENAHLIAAAPDLLDALKTLHVKAAIAVRALALVHVGDAESALKQLSEELWIAPRLVAKAEGREQ